MASSIWTTPLRHRSIRASSSACSPYFSEFFGNPSSIYGLGRKSLAALDAAHETVARLLNCRPTEIVFTGGGSEADNLAIKGVAYSPRRRGKHIITSAIEHHAVLRTCEQLEHEGYSVTYLPVDGDGLVNPADVAAAITDETALVTIMYVNNEVGTVQPIAEIGRICRERRVPFHVDAVQGALLDLDVAALAGGPADTLGAQVLRPQGRRHPLRAPGNAHPATSARRLAGAQPARGHRERAGDRRRGGCV